MILKELHSIKGKSDKIKFVSEKGVREELIAEKMALYGIGKPAYKSSKNAIIKHLPQSKNSALLKSPIDINDDEVFIIVNSVGFFDSHYDVSLKNSWNKTISESGNQIKNFLDHNYGATSLYALNKGAYVVDVPIRSLGYDADGSTQAWGMKIKPSEDILSKYKQGYPIEHSGGLQYVKLELAVNNEQEEEGYKFWQKYYPQVINKEIVDQYGFFFAVQEQKAIEASAVGYGSNSYTPAFTNNDKSLNQSEPLKDTPKGLEPSKKGEDFFKHLIY